MIKYFTLQFLFYSKYNFNMLKLRPVYKTTRKITKVEFIKAKYSIAKLRRRTVGNFRNVNIIMP